MSLNNEKMIMRKSLPAGVIAASFFRIIPQIRNYKVHHEFNIKSALLIVSLASSSTYSPDGIQIGLSGRQKRGYLDFIPWISSSLEYFKISEKTFLSKSLLNSFSKNAVTLCSPEMKFRIARQDFIAFSDD